MNLAITDRSGPDTSPHTLHVDRSNDIDSAILGRPVPPHYPALGTLVCAKGIGGWHYIGAVTAIDEDAGTYTILPVAMDRTADKIKAWGRHNPVPSMEK
jgi:hypothetical protein